MCCAALTHARTARPPLSPAPHSFPHPPPPTRQFYKYWICAEGDFLDPKRPYSLRDTGQGLNRLQSCPRVGQAMREVLHRVQTAEQQWVGSSVVHLGDTNVPNSFAFLDKYTQVSRVLSPLVLVVESIPKLLREVPALSAYVDKQFGSEDGLVKAILGDFFRSGFDGSGADNFFDAGACARPLTAATHTACGSLNRPHPAQPTHTTTQQTGSCIDGRLTSAWEWCSKIDRKPFAPVFRLCSVLGFDGRWEGK